MIIVVETDSFKVEVETFPNEISLEDVVCRYVPRENNQPERWELTKPRSLDEGKEFIDRDKHYKVLQFLNK